MITICSGWRGINGRRVHRDDKLVMPDDGQPGPARPGICVPCKEAMLALMDYLVLELDELNQRAKAELNQRAKGDRR